MVIDTGSIEVFLDGGVKAASFITGAALGKIGAAIVNETAGVAEIEIAQLATTSSEEGKR